MVSTPNTQTLAITGAAEGIAEFPDGRAIDNSIIGAAVPAAGTFTNLTVTGTFTRTGGNTPLAPVAVGATASATSAQSGKTFLLNNAAGSVLTLPAATGSGATYKVIVTTTTTSGAHKVLAASVSDFMNGIAIGFTGSTAKVFASAAATNHSLQMPFTGSQPSGGFIGDTYDIVDVAANLWNVSGSYQAGTTPTTPYSSATT